MSSPVHPAYVVGMPTKLALWMRANGKRDKDVAKAVGCSRVQINRVRNGIVKPSPELALKLEKLTAIPWHEFIHAGRKPAAVSGVAGSR